VKKLNKPFKCPSCNRVHQREDKSLIACSTYFPDFPSYGLEKRKCEECVDKKEKVIA